MAKVKQAIVVVEEEVILFAGEMNQELQKIINSIGE